MTNELTSTIKSLDILIREKREIIAEFGEDSELSSQIEELENDRDLLIAKVEQLKGEPINMEVYQQLYEKLQDGTITQRERDLLMAEYLKNNVLNNQ
jgi:hypothetical protein